MDDLKSMSLKMKVGDKRTSDQTAANHSNGQINNSSQNGGPNRDLKSNNSSKTNGGGSMLTANLIDDSFGFNKKTHGGDGFRPAFGEGNEGGIDDFFSKDDKEGDFKRQRTTVEKEP